MAQPRSAPRSTQKTSPTTSSPADFDLDALEYEPDRPFVVKLGGRKLTFNSIRDLDWQVSAALSPDRPHQFFESIVREEDQEFFLAQRVPGKKLSALMEAYWEFYGIDPGGSGA